MAVTVADTQNSEDHKLLHVAFFLSKMGAELPAEACGPVEGSRLVLQRLEPALGALPCFGGHALPTLLVLGAMKCGTTGLHRELTVWGLHHAAPRLNATRALCGGCGAALEVDGRNLWRRKELGYFSSDEWLGGLERYAARAPRCAVCAGALDATTAYLSSVAAPRRAALSFAAVGAGEPLLVVMLRDPLPRVVSQYYHQEKAGRRPEARTPLGAWLERRLDDADRCRARGGSTAARRRLDGELARWPESTLQRLCARLGLPATGAREQLAVRLDAWNRTRRSGAPAQTAATLDELARDGGDGAGERAPAEEADERARWPLCGDEHGALQRGLYGDQLARWRRFFAAERFALVPLAEYARDPRAAVRGVLEAWGAAPRALAGELASVGAATRQRPNHRTPATGAQNLSAAHAARLRAYYRASDARLGALIDEGGLRVLPSPSGHAWRWWGAAGREPRARALARAAGGGRLARREARDGGNG